ARQALLQHGHQVDDVAALGPSGLLRATFRLAGLRPGGRPPLLCAAAARGGLDQPSELIAEHTDWRFLEELKRELKAYRARGFWSSFLGPGSLRKFLIFAVTVIQADRGQGDRTGLTGSENVVP